MLRDCTSRLIVLLLAVAGCSGGGLGDVCGGPDDCESSLQCLNRHCEARCQRAPDCGDGNACDASGSCVAATAGRGDVCASEVDCAAGLSCQLDGTLLDNTHLRASCGAVNPTNLAGGECTRNADCRNGTCVLGHCTDLCRQDRDCATGQSCMRIPSDLAFGVQFSGCLPSRGSISWSIPMSSPLAEIQVPVPSAAVSAEVVMSVSDPAQKVGAISVLSPRGTWLYNLPCSTLRESDPPCDAVRATDAYFANQLRHLPGVGQSVLSIPSGAMTDAIGPGMYRIRVSSFRANDEPGTAVPRVTAVVRMDAGDTLDLHFFFLDLKDHPCAAMTGRTKLDAADAAAAPYFQSDYLAALRGLLAQSAEIKLGTVTYEDIRDRPELDELDVADAAALFKLGKYASGINVFFVRSLSPAGLQAIGPYPGPAGVARTRQSGIAIGLDTACYRDWRALARLTAHEIGRYLGLPHNVELDVARHPTWRDPFPDSDDSSNNLMYFTDLAGPAAPAGTDLSAKQREALRRSPALR